MSKAPDLEGFTKEEIKEYLNEVRHPFEIAVYDSSNYFNLGNIVRTGHNFLVRKIYSVSLDKFYKKAACGGYKYENIEKYSLEEFIKSFSDRSIVAFERRPGILHTEDLRSFEWPANPILFFGSEKTGVPDEILEVASNVVSIPQFGVINDNNVGCAASIAMYDWIYKYYKA